MKARPTTTRRAGRRSESSQWANLRHRSGPTAQAAVRQLAPYVAPDALICDQSELGTYECDGLTQFRARPAFALLVSSAEDVRRLKAYAPS